jgi:putative ABC transport system substrate-binding protein
MLPRSPWLGQQMQFDRLKRREFITLLGAAAAWPMPTYAQKGPIPTIGFLSARSPRESVGLVAAFRKGLNEDGYVESKTAAIEYRWAEDRLDQLPGLAADLVRRQVAVIAAVTTPGALAAKVATSVIPIVFVAGGDPVDLGLVASLSRPGGNVTGISLLTFELLRKRVELIRELVPNISTIGLLINPTNTTAEISQRDAQEAAGILDRRIVIASASSQTDFATAFASLAAQGAGGLVVSPDPFFNGHSGELGALAVQQGIPAIAEVREFAAAGGLVSYGTSFADAYRQAGVYTGRLLKGAKPADLPVMQATKFEMVINLKTARALGLTVPLPLLARADEVIE